MFVCAAAEAVDDVHRTLLEQALPLSLAVQAKALLEEQSIHMEADTATS